MDSEFFGEPDPVATRHQALQAMLPFIEEELDRGVYLSNITRHIMGLFHGQPGGRQFRRHISENAHRPGSGIEVVLDALAKVHQPAPSPTREAVI